MASTVVNTSSKPVRKAGYPADSLRFDWLMALLGGLFVFGLYLDGWAHNHGMVDTSFFTIWHAALYGSFALCGATLIGSHFYNILRGYAWDKALPRGYMLALIAVFIFAIGGLADMGWHMAFGIEEDTEALLSPSHMTLAVGIFLILSSPFRAFWQRKTKSQSLVGYLPMLISAAMILSIMTFFIQFASLTETSQLLIGNRPREYWWRDILGISSALLTPALTTGLILLMLRRWNLPFGSVTLILTINNLLMIWMNLENDAEFLYFGLTLTLVGLLIDGIIFWLKPHNGTALSYRILGAAIPFLMVMATMGALQFYGAAYANNGLWWNIHMWLGVPVLSAIGGLFLSLLVFPPAIPED